MFSFIKNNFKLTKQCSTKSKKIFAIDSPFGPIVAPVVLPFFHSKTSLTNIFKAKMINIFKGRISGRLRPNKVNFDIRCEY